VSAAIRTPDSLPDPDRPPGTPDEALPFEHVVVIVMENHSFDNLLGALPIMGQPLADGLSFDAQQAPVNSNPGPGGPVRSFAFPSTAQGSNVSQTWNATHVQIDGGAMDGFVRSVNAAQPMGYWTAEQLPFAYSLGRSFALANRWFSSAPCQTIPNRRFLIAGTASGLIASEPTKIFTDPQPPNGTIFDRLDAHGISWSNYFTDIPYTAILPPVVEKHWKHLHRMDRFLADCASGSLPAVSFVDPEIGVISELGVALSSLPLLKSLGEQLSAHGGSEEDPQDMSYGERWAYEKVTAVLRSPAWPRALLIYTYDEHGGYYDHAPPHPAVPPDDTPPKLSPGDAPGGYDMYGIRVPAVIASPFAKPSSVSDVIHDHTSVLATIEQKWNLPALTYRDANANTVLDLIDPRSPALLEPPTLDDPGARPQ
jgi:phospholipase C